MDIIKSRQNEYIKSIRKLSQAKYRRETGLCYVEGYKCVREAADYSDVDCILYTEDADIGEFDGISCRKLCISRDIMEYLSETRTPQDISCVTSFSERELDADGRLVIVMEDVQDPQNVGAVIRTADAVGAAGVIMTSGCADHTSSRAIRSSMGSCFHLPVLRTDDVLSLIDGLREKGYSVVAAHLKGREDAEIPERAVLLIGNESRGLSEQISGKADVLLRIPMKGKAESLNASVAAGVLMYRLTWK